jgi:hypothetical protein
MGIKGRSRLWAGQRAEDDLSARAFVARGRGSTVGNGVPDLLCTGISTHLYTGRHIAVVGQQLSSSARGPPCLRCAVLSRVIDLDEVRAQRG